MLTSWLAVSESNSWTAIKEPWLIPIVLAYYTETPGSENGANHSNESIRICSRVPLFADWRRYSFRLVSKLGLYIFLAEHPTQSQNTGADLQAFHEHRHKWIREDHVSEGGGITVYRSSHERESANTRAVNQEIRVIDERRWSVP